MDIKPLDAVFVEYMKVESGGRLKRYLAEILVMIPGAAKAA